MASVIEICNRALSNIGNSRSINSLTEASKEAGQCSLHFDACRDAALADFDWNFATKRLALADTLPYEQVSLPPESAVQVMLQRAAALAVTCQFYGSNDPALPLKAVKVPGVLAPRLKDRFSYNERTLLVRDGISTTTVSRDGNIYLERIVTTYQENSAGIADSSLSSLEAKWTVDYYRYVVRTQIGLKFPRHKQHKPCQSWQKQKQEVR